MHIFYVHIRGFKTPQLSPANLAGKTKNPKTRVFNVAVGFHARFLRPPAMIAANTGQGWKSKERWWCYGWWPDTEWLETRNPKSTKSSTAVGFHRPELRLQATISLEMGWVKKREGQGREKDWPWSLGWSDGQEISRGRGGRELHRGRERDLSWWDNDKFGFNMSCISSSKCRG